MTLEDGRRDLIFRKLPRWFASALLQSIMMLIGGFQFSQNKAKKNSSNELPNNMLLFSDMVKELELRVQIPIITAALIKRSWLATGYLLEPSVPLPTSTCVPTPPSFT